MNTYLTPPGPKGLPFLGSSYHYFKDILGFITNVHESYGEIAFFKLGNRKIYMLSDPEKIKDVLVTDHKNFTKS